MNPRNFYNRTAGIYDKRHSTPSSQIIRKRELKLVRRFAQGRVLDFGCGTGQYISFANVGVDISEGMLKTAKRSGKPLILGDENLCFKEKTFDTALCMLTVLNMCNYQKVISELAEVIKPGGRAILSVASVYDKGKNAETKKKIGVNGSAMELHLFTKQELLDIFEQNGFKLEHFDSLFILQKPRWGSFETPSVWERAKLFLERLMPKAGGCVYLAVFRKT